MVLPEFRHGAVGPAFTRREARWALGVVALLWLSSLGVLLLLVAWSLKRPA